MFCFSSLSYIVFMHDVDLVHFTIQLREVCNHLNVVPSSVPASELRSCLCLLPTPGFVLHPLMSQNTRKLLMKIRIFPNYKFIRVKNYLYGYSFIRLHALSFLLCAPNVSVKLSIVMKQIKNIATI